MRLVNDVLAAAPPPARVLRCTCLTDHLSTTPFQFVLNNGWQALVGGCLLQFVTRRTGLGVMLPTFLRGDVAKCAGLGSLNRLGDEPPPTSFDQRATPANHVRSCYLIRFKISILLHAPSDTNIALRL